MREAWRACKQFAGQWSKMKFGEGNGSPTTLKLGVGAVTMGGLGTGYLYLNDKR
jgi:hypothetical protein